MSPPLLVMVKLALAVSAVQEPTAVSLGGTGVLVGVAVGVMVAVTVGVKVGVFSGVFVGVLVGYLEHEPTVFNVTEDRNVVR